MLVPRPAPSQEQAIRSARLEEWDVARVESLVGLDGARLATRILEATAADPPECPVTMDGVRNTLDLFDQVTRQALAA